MGEVDRRPALADCHGFTAFSGHGWARRNRLTRSGIIAWALAVVVVGGLVAANLRAEWAREAARSENALRQARIESIKAAPAYAALLAHGTRTCHDQVEGVIWICGAIIALPFAVGPDPVRGQLCSSPDAPEFVGSFPLPDVVSLDPDTEGAPITPGTSVFPDGRYSHSWLTRVTQEPDGRMSGCKPGDNGYRSLILTGNSALQLGFPPTPLPATLLIDPPAPADLVGNHALAIDAFLDLDESPVTYRASGHTEGQES
jgi:hypothetical protein